ncbi:MAG: TonB-dependent receptor plug domain-containing protein [Crocinitomicaceae bacterium]
MTKFTATAIFSIFISALIGQNNIKLIHSDTIPEVIVISSRIDLPFSKNSRTIQVISAADIERSGVNNIPDLLQQVAGVDVRRRGTNGMQADLYIRGGSFDQTLLLIDGIKVEDAQTGHHTLNLALPIEVIERIEIVKGPAARIFGQNAFNGAVNIVTKSGVESQLSLQTEVGSFGQKNFEVNANQKLAKSNHIVQFSRNLSDGYRYNTDYDNLNYFLKSSFNTKRLPIDVLATFMERKFGANGFYATPAATEQYEETQGSLVALQTKLKKGNLTVKPNLYWRRNQDEYIFIRNNPSVYRNLHLSNKLGAEVNLTYQSKFGTTGVGLDVAQIFLRSNNLGDRNRLMSTIFVEHLFHLFNGKLDITPGFAANYFSDFEGNIFPGIDIGYTLNEAMKLYANVGQTYRIPTYTDLFYSDPNTLGNENLRQEEALSQEMGIKYDLKAFHIQVSAFNRQASNLIDYVKANEFERFKAENIRNVNTKGFEAEANYRFKIKNKFQKLTLGYTFLDDDLSDIDAAFSRYSINSTRHQVVSQFHSQFSKYVSQSIIYRYMERSAGQSYQVLDANIRAKVKRLEMQFIINNIFDIVYSEQNLVPMPKRNFLIGVKYVFK